MCVVRAGEYVIMASMPREPEAFAEQVVCLLKRLKPELDVSLAGPSELIVNGRRLDLDNLYRLVSTDEPRGVEIVEQYLDHLFDDDSLAAAAMPWQVARNKIMPRIQPVSIFEHLSREMVAHVPYVNETIVVFVIDMPQMTVSVTTEQMLKWGMNAEELDEIARENLRAFTPEFEFRSIDTDEGGHAIILAQQDGYDASRLLLDEFFLQVAPEMDGDFYAACPSRDMLLALSCDPEQFVSRVRSRIDEDFLRLPYPITNKLFYVTRDGIAGTATEAA